MSSYLMWGLVLLAFLSCQPVNGQGQQASLNDQARALHDAYDRYQEPRLKDRRFKHEDVEALIKRLPAAFEVQTAGHSIEGRAIYRVQWGNGPIQVLLWSQMHGDEPTATAALFDVFNFLAQDERFPGLKRSLADRLTLTFLPMLNPDGANRFVRRNTLGIDLNRDALRLAAPETNILKNVRDELDADWGFNLHDQSRYYSAGYPSSNTAALAFLAPAYNFEKEVNPVRENAMLVIGELSDMLQQFIPGQVARYDDAFEPRAFGDNMQKWGTSTILIESGGYPQDREKQYIRQLNFVSLLIAFRSIAEGHYTQQEVDAYHAIPFNDSNNFFDLLLRQVQVEVEDEVYTLDIGLRLNEIDYNRNRKYYFRGSIADMGDLTYHTGYAEPAVQNMSARAGAVYPQTLPDYAALQRLSLLDLLQEGYSYIRLEDLPAPELMAALPIQILSKDGRAQTKIVPYTNPSMLISEDNNLRFVVVNGQAFSLEELANFRWP